MALLTACAVKPAITNQYQLSSYSVIPSTHSCRWSILVSQPQAMAGYDTEEMLYMKKPFEIAPFAHNAWINPPADMLLPLITQSLQKSGYFYAVAASSSTEKTDYRLDTQLIELKQNFLCKPSRMEFIAKVAINRVSDERLIASKLLSYQITTPLDTPYGGVIAANKIMLMFTADINKFVIAHIS